MTVRIMPRDLCQRGDRATKRDSGTEVIASPFKVEIERERGPRRV
jgi:hypothetical protein